MDATCTRQKFIDAIESGIRAAGDAMPAADRALLRHVGATEDSFLIGNFWDGMIGCGCPLTLAGIVPTTYGSSTGPLTNVYIYKFYCAFDSNFPCNFYKITVCE